MFDTVGVSAIHGLQLRGRRLKGVALRHKSAQARKVVLGAVEERSGHPVCVACDAVLALGVHGGTAAVPAFLMTVGSNTAMAE